MMKVRKMSMENNMPERDDCPVPAEDNDSVEHKHPETDAVEKTDPFELTYKDVFDPIEGKLKSIKDWVIPVPMTEAEVGEMDELVESFAKDAEAKMDPEDAKKAIMDYANRIRITYIGHWLNGEYHRIFERPEKLSQKVESEKGPIHITGQAIANKDTTLAGPAALMALQSTLGIGKPVKIPLWHSGVVVTVSNFKETESMALAHAIDEQRMELGYATQGFLFSGKDVNIVSEIVDFVLRHVITTNIKGWLVGDIAVLRELILVNDIPSLLAGALEAMYPSGYPTERQCKNSGTDKCDYRAASIIDLNSTEFRIDTLLRFGRCVWTDNRRISSAAARHMSAGSGMRDKEHILEYQKAFNTTEPLSKKVNMDDAEITIALQQPNLERYINLGQQWIDSVIGMVNNTVNQFNDLSESARVEKRKQYIAQAQHMQRLQKEAGWIKTIQFKKVEDEQPFLVEDDATIFNLLETLAENPTVADAILDRINRYKEDTQVSFTGIPNYRCPVCGESQVEGKMLKHGIIPMDMVGYFFTIVGYQTLRITSDQIES